MSVVAVSLYNKFNIVYQIFKLSGYFVLQAEDGIRDIGVTGVQTCALPIYLPEGVMVFAFPSAHWRLLRTTNGLERLNQEIRRRTRVARLFPAEASCLRLVIGRASCRARV